MTENDYTLAMKLFSRRSQEINNWIGPTVKHVLWNIAMLHVLHNFFGLSKTQQLTSWADTAFISFY